MSDATLATFEVGTKIAKVVWDPGAVLPNEKNASIIGVGDTLNTNRGDREPEETTRVYKQVAHFIQQMANERGVPVRYKFQTSNRKLKGWAQTKAPTIFGSWDTITEQSKTNIELEESQPDDDTSFIVCTKLFTPVKRK